MADKLIIKWRKVVQLKTTQKEQPSENEREKEKEKEIKSENKEKEKIPDQRNKIEKRAAAPSLGKIKY
jgi:hypothetical protein